MTLDLKYGDASYGPTMGGGRGSWIRELDDERSTTNWECERCGAVVSSRTPCRCEPVDAEGTENDCVCGHPRSYHGDGLGSSRCAFSGCACPMFNERPHWLAAPTDAEIDAAATDALTEDTERDHEGELIPKLDKKVLYNAFLALQQQWDLTIDWFINDVDVDADQLALVGQQIAGTIRAIQQER